MIHWLIGIVVAYFVWAYIATFVVCGAAGVVAAGAWVVDGLKPSRPYSNRTSLTDYELDPPEPLNADFD